jgi:branched-chain amino acid transport system ATP-binding protein
VLEVAALHAFYGKSHVLHGVDFSVGRGEIVSLLGRNGAGRSTALKAIMGLVTASGSVKLNGQEILGLPPHQVALKGIGYVPEDRAVFADLTVRQNLLLGEKKGSRGSASPGSGSPGSGSPGFGDADAFKLFPRLQERADVPGGVLSGGEQQMLTLCRTMMGNPSLLLVDEPTEGLAPMVVAQVAAFLCEMQKRGVAILLVEQKLAIALDISQRLYVLGHGRAVFSGTPDELRGNPSVRKEWLEV